MGGKIPFPPEKIVEKLNALNIEVVASIFPHGRSLERNVTDYEKPRSLIAFNLAPPSKPAQFVFIAYTPGNQGLQIISRNQKAKGYDFKLVNSYANGKTPEIVTPPSRGLCTSCHQNGGPIFSVNPWSESQNSPDVAKRLVETGSKLDGFAKFLMIDPRVSLSAYSYEGFVFSANEIPIPHRSCAHVCSGNENCKLAMIDAALKSALESVRQESMVKLFENSKVSLAEISEQVSNGHRLLADDSSEQIVSRRMTNAEFESFHDKVKADDFFGIELAGTSIKDRISFNHEHEIASGPGNDPLLNRMISPRDSIVFKTTFRDLNDVPFKNLIVGAESEICLAKFSLPQLRVLGKMNEMELERAMRSQAYKKLAKSFPPSPASILSVLLTEIKKKPSQAVKNEVKVPCKENNPSPSDTANMTAKNVFTVANRFYEMSEPVEHKETSELFVRFCASCHYGNGSLAPTLPLMDVNALKEYKGTAGRTLESVLSAPDFLMPPEGSIVPSTKDREEMINAVKASVDKKP